MSGRNRVGMLRYWSLRYFLVLFSCLTVVALLAVWLLQAVMRADQYSGMRAMAQQLSGMAGISAGRLPGDTELGRQLDRLASEHGLDERVVMWIWDNTGNTLRQFPPHPPEEGRQLAARKQELLGHEAQVIKLEPLRSRPPFLVASQPLPADSGYLLLFFYEKRLFDTLAVFQVPRLILSGTIILSGWIVIFVLMRRMMRPIAETAEAAKQIVAGNYDIQLDRDHPERELSELTGAFQEMTDRLKRLEALRTQLLAGVTHELKTPITSIGGLLQAVKGRVVTGEEADKFLDVCLQETRRMQKMVEDLLDFNSFAGQTVAVAPEWCDLQQVVAGIAERWLRYRNRSDVELHIRADAAVRQWRVRTDPERLEQIVVNLLHNAADAMAEGGAIWIRLSGRDESFDIEVKDEGHGIAAEERQDIFEPFYRGQNKKARVRGLGLGLPFSRLIARSLGGDLQLTESGPHGTAFTVRIAAMRPVNSSEGQQAK